MNKTGKAIDLLRQGKFLEALAIIAKFRIGFTKEEKRVLEIAHESLAGNATMYRSMGIDTDLCIRKAKDIVSSKYNVKQQEQ